MALHWDDLVIKHPAVCFVKTLTRQALLVSALPTCYSMDQPRNPTAVLTDMDKDFEAQQLLSDAEQGLLLALARVTVERAARGESDPKVDGCGVPPKLLEHRASFVTLMLDGRLRGCVGNLTAQQPLYLSVLRNARAAALRDTRFAPLSRAEAEVVSIKISVLTPLLPVSFANIDELLGQLTPGKHGVVLRTQGRQGTFLPQVWEQFPDKTAFMNSLSRKAGLGENDWRLPGTEILLYETQSFGEEDNGRISA